jgi:ribosomal protein S25
MGQQEIIQLLKKQKKWVTSKEIANKLGVGMSCTLVKLRSLRKRNEIIFKKENKQYYYKL